MVKQAKIKITSDLLTTLMGFNWKYDIVNAQIDHSIYGKNVLELIIESKCLPDIFEVSPGQKVKDAVVVLHVVDVQSEIKAI